MELIYSKELENLKNTIGDFTEKNIYLLASYPYEGKTTFCIDIAMSLFKSNKRVLYISSSMLKTDFEKQLLRYNDITFFGNPHYIQLHYLDNKRLDDILQTNEYDFIIIDSDTLMLDVDIGLLKESIINHNVGVLMTKQLSRGRWFRKKRHVLSNLRFINQKTKLKYVAYSDAIIFIQHDSQKNERKLIVTKNTIRKN